MPTVNVEEPVYKELLRVEGFLQMKNKEKYSLSEVVAFLLQNMPEISMKIDPEEGFEYRREKSE